MPLLGRKIEGTCKKCNKDFAYTRSGFFKQKPQTRLCPKCYKMFLNYRHESDIKLNKLYRESVGIYPHFFSLEDIGWGEEGFMNCSEARV